MIPSTLVCSLPVGAGRFFATLLLPVVVSACSTSSSAPDVGTDAGTASSGSSRDSSSDTASSTSGSSGSSGGEADAAERGETGGSSEAGLGPEGGIGGSAAAVHDDFENETGMPGSPWQLTDENGVPATQYTPVTTVTIDGAHAHGGTHAVKVAAGGGFFGTAPPGASFYGRAWVYFGASPGTNHWAFVEGVGPGMQGTASQVRLGGNLGVYDANIQTSGPEDEIRGSAPDGGLEPPPVAQWTCFEFYYGTDTLKVWQGGELILDVGPSTPWMDGNIHSPWSPQYVAIRLGYASFGAAAIDLWFDDVALDAQKIGCN